MTSDLAAALFLCITALVWAWVGAVCDPGLGQALAFTVAVLLAVAAVVCTWRQQ